MGRVRKLLIFLGHEFVSTWGVGISAALVTAFSFAILRPLAPRLFDSHKASWLLTETPYFPVQIILGLWLGRWIWRRFQHSSMFWVWLPAVLILSCAILKGPVFMLKPESALEQVSFAHYTLRHYFGSGCSPRDFCEDQLVFTMPFYSSVAYALGAFAARWAPIRNPTQSK
jgi:hypothetical protein